MEKMMEQVNDLHVANYVVYAKAADSKLYLESDFTTQVDQADAEAAFKKGRLLIVDDTKMLVPVAMSSNSVFTVGGDDDAATLVEWVTKATV